MSRKRTKKSVFCDKTPSAGVTNGIVWFKAEHVWRICKGKLYKNGYFCYYHNGHTAVVGPRNYKVYPKVTLEQLEAETQKMNLQLLVLLEWGHPRTFPRRSGFRCREVLEDVPDPRQPRQARPLQEAIDAADAILTNANIPVETPAEDIVNMLTTDEVDRLMAELETIIPEAMRDENG